MKRVNIKKAYLQKLGKRQSCDIWLVDGCYIRQYIYPDFVYGGNDRRYLFIPKKEIWIDSEVSAKEIEFTILHEIYERRLMAKGMTYEQAHKKVLDFERRKRQLNNNEPTAKIALDKNTTIVNEVIKKLSEKSIPADDIQTSFYNLTPVYNNVNNFSEIISYTAEQQLTVKVRDIQNKGEKKIGKIIEVASNAGVNQVNGISYDYLELDKIKQQARIMAINDARYLVK